MDAKIASVFRAEPNSYWPGGATVSIAKVWMRKGKWNGQFSIDEKVTNGITPSLSDSATRSGEPYPLVVNLSSYFRGTEIKGTGFVIDESNASSLIERDDRNRQILFPYLTGNDLNSTPDQSATRWVINFHEWPIEKAKEFEECFAIVTEHVKPYRATITKQIHEPDYWKFWDKRIASYRSILKMQRVVAISLVTNYVSFAFIPATGIVYSHKVAIIASELYEVFALLQSSMQYLWAWEYSPRNLSLLAYSPPASLTTFPFPNGISFSDALQLDDVIALRTIGIMYDKYRSEILQARQEGLTTIYGYFHSQRETALDIQHLRELHTELDRAVAAAYGWDDLDLDHGFHQTKQGLRFTISEPARREVLDRLLALNHARYEEEVRQGLHDKGAKKAGGGKKGKKVPVGQVDLGF